MDIRIGSKDAPPASLDAAVADIGRQLAARRGEWLRELAEQPTRLGPIERQVHNAFSRLADHMVAGLLAEASQASAMQAEKKSPR